MPTSNKKSSKSSSSKSSGSRTKQSSGSKHTNRNKKKKVSEAKVVGAGTLLIIVVAFLYHASGCDIDISGTPFFEPDDTSNTSSITNIHYLDVGQGDSILICGSEKNVLIDGGERDYGETVIADLKEYGVETIDYIIGTHPHSDHIGGLVDVLRYAASNDDLSVEAVIIPEVPEESTPTSYTYQKFLDGINRNNIGVTFAEYEMKLDIGSGVITLYPPLEDNTYKSLNDYSVCAYLECGDTSFFFTGDMEKSEEKDFLEAGTFDGIHADVLKAGHHGSSTSSSNKFLEQIDPNYIVISCGSGNSYGHPHKESMQRFKEYTNEIYRTDTDGTITCTTDGKTLAWSVKGN